ncbi:HTH-type transcriptional regulator RutR [Erwinia sp. HR93]|uniref:HTH-type transcriptional regulator RutR n=1 Tax=Erwinia sp. HR93 TaxID=3094840 RepID=UPI002ADEA5DB|nr:HTH-type transcriptional regulator RutR [Erwinia sp. HR93]MEA1064786.1 HTH-type transcriptional regulator RutR [Erwinia sp. HR93]
MADQGEASGRRTRAVAAKKKAIMRAGLALFSRAGLHGVTLDQIAERAQVSKTNLLYYFPSKEALYVAVLRDILDIWLAPLKAFRENLRPREAIGDYIRLKMTVSRDFPEASRLFCLEILQGAPLLKAELAGSLKALIEEKSAIIRGWVQGGELAACEPYHLIFMIWATTQHYADFATQIEAVTGQTLQNAVFFQQAVDNVQRMLMDGLIPR